MYTLKENLWGLISIFLALLIFKKFDFINAVELNFSYTNCSSTNEFSSDIICDSENNRSEIIAEYSGNQTGGFLFMSCSNVPSSCYTRFELGNQSLLHNVKVNGYVSLSGEILVKLRVPRNTEDILLGLIKEKGSWVEKTWSLDDAYWNRDDLTIEVELRRGENNSTSILQTVQLVGNWSNEFAEQDGEMLENSTILTTTGGTSETWNLTQNRKNLNSQIQTSTDLPKPGKRLVSNSPHSNATITSLSNLNEKPQHQDPNFNEGGNTLVQTSIGVSENLKPGSNNIVVKLSEDNDDNEATESNPDDSGNTGTEANQDEESNPDGGTEANQEEESNPDGDTGTEANQDEESTTGSTDDNSSTNTSEDATEAGGTAENPDNTGEDATEADGNNGTATEENPQEENGESTTSVSETESTESSTGDSEATTEVGEDNTMATIPTTEFPEDSDSASYQPDRTDRDNPVTEASISPDSGRRDQNTWRNRIGLYVGIVSIMILVIGVGVMLIIYKIKKSRQITHVTQF